MMKKFGLLLGVFCLWSLAYPPLSSAATLGDVNTLINGSVTYAGQESNLVISQTSPGVYQIKANSFPCIPSASCEPDRYQIDLGRRINHVFGLGMVNASGQVELADFLDTSFGSGHLDAPIDKYEGDIGRMRTPVFVMPSENLIVAYIQPTVKMLRLSRTSNSTSMILKKHNTYVEGAPAPLLIVKGTNPQDMYQKYYTYLKTHGFSFRKPAFSVFGVGWETFDEFGCTATFPEVTSATDKFLQAGIPLSFAIIGSGYWNNDTGEGGCGTPGLPTTDTLVQSQARFGQYGGLNQLFTNLKAKGIAPGIGMRLNVQQSNVAFIQSQFAGKGISDPFLNSYIYYGNSPSDNARLLDAAKPNVVDAFIELSQAAYGQYGGIKEDEMFYADQLHVRGLPNLPDGFISKSYPRYYQKLGNDFFIIGRNDWFSVQSDANSSQGWVDIGIPNWDGYANLKPMFDSIMTQVVSGYPHPMMEPTVHSSSNLHDEASKSIPAAKNKEYLRTRAIQTFLPVDTFSRGFWHITDSTYRNAAIFFAQLRARLHHYAFDQSQKWFETGVPQLMQPLFIRFSDSTIANMYSKPGNKDDTRNEFMFGNALLVRPLFSDSDTVSVYLPSGRWRPFLAVGSLLNGGQSINYSLASPYDYPVFLKEGEILVIAENANSQNLQATVFLDGTNPSSEYSFYHKTSGQKIRLQALLANGQVVVKNLDSGASVSTQDDAYGKGFKIANINSLVSGPIAGDVNGDGQVNATDLLEIVKRMMTSSVAGYDLDQNGKVNAIDFITALKIFQ